MVRVGKGGSKRVFKKRVKGDRSSDDSDEDYVVSDEQTDASDVALEDLAVSESEDGIGETVDNEVLNEDDDANDYDYVEETYEVEEDGEEAEGEELGGDEEENKVVKSDVKWGSSGPRKSVSKTSRKRSRFSQEEDDDEDFDANDEDDEDDEFTPDEDECLDDDEEDSVVKRRKIHKQDTHKKSSRRGTRKKVAKNSKKRTKFAAPKSLSKKKGSKIKRKRTETRHNNKDEEDADYLEDKLIVREKGRRTLRRRRRYSVRSDSDFQSSGSSDFEYTISEEEREQVREASDFCRNLAVVPVRRRSSSEKCVKEGCLRVRRAAPSREMEKDVNITPRRKSPSVKGKQKVEEVSIKQVCGICLSEEDKRRVRGTINCCSHYFCFTCIMEWSKVESRCPLCKQRFQTISKPARSAAGVDLRDAVIHVPERDQVYQPTEEEIRGYLDPYENVICTECHEGGDDGLMLLCDICDSPAHTYCVGLGGEVPEGNWYCEGCRPGVLGNSSAYSQDPVFADDRIGINGGDGLDLNVTPSPLPFTQGVGGLASPRFNSVINQAASQFSGAGASTVSGRRRMQRHFQQILTGHRINLVPSRTDGISAARVSHDSLASHVDQWRTSPNAQFRTPELRTSLENIFRERLPETSSPSVRSAESVQFRHNSSRRQEVEVASVVPPSIISRAVSFDERGTMNGPTLASEHPPRSTSSRSSFVDEFAATPNTVSEASQLCKAKEQVQSMVKNHLKSISKDALGHEFKDIARSSTNTILAACGLDHRKSEVQDCALSPPLPCWHSELVPSGRLSLIDGLCSGCFDVYVKGVVESVMNTRSRPWLSLGL